jgi:metal-responsive CopG/Arc/MetJ family transcriptional regulator
MVTTDVSRFTVSVPARLLAAMDERLIRNGESRSALIRRLLEQALEDEDEKERVEQYVRGYQEQPQTDDEFGWTDQIAVEQLRETAWR